MSDLTGRSMDGDRNATRVVRSWLHEDRHEDADRVLGAALDEVATTPQRRPPWSAWRAPTMNKFLAIGLGTAAVVAILFASAALRGSFGLVPGGEPSTSTAPSVDVPGEIQALLNGFLQARIVGEGAEEYLSPEANVPLLYATSSGASYERAEFEPVAGIEWPYGWTAFQVRLFAGDTVVEQLIFADVAGGLEYQPDGFGIEIAPTTENGQPLAVTHTAFDGEVSMIVAHPWVSHDGSPYVAKVPEGQVQPTTDGGGRHGEEWDSIWLLADPLPVGTGCQAGPNPADAEALAQSLLSDPDLETTATVTVSVGGTEAQVVDVQIAAGASICQYYDRPEAFTNAQGELLDIGFDAGDRMRLYLFDAPAGSSMRILALAIIAPESRFDNVVEAAAPVVDSLEFHVR